MSAPDRAHPLTRHVVSLKVNADAKDAWEVVAEQRDAELESGFVGSVAFEKAMARLQARLP